MADTLLDTLQTSCQTSDEDTAGVVERKLNSWALAHKYAKFDPIRAQRVVRCCNTVLELVWTDTGETRQISSFLCGDRFCAMCARRRSAKLAQRYRSVIDENCEGLHGHLLTLTYKNSENLRERRRISKDVRNLMRRPFWKRHGGIVGGLYSVEVTRGEGGWHPHVHLLVFTRFPIASYQDGKWLVELNQEVSAAWLSITGDSFIVRGETWDGNVEEVVKYMTKAPQSLPVEKLRELTRWARGMRAVSAFGHLYHKKVSEDVDEDPIARGGPVTVRVRRFKASRRDYETLKTVSIELHEGATVRDVFSLVMRQ